MSSCCLMHWLTLIVSVEDSLPLMHEGPSNILTMMPAVREHVARME